MKKLTILIALLACAFIVGCGEAAHSENYSTDVELTPEQKAQAEANMAGQKAPGAITPGQPVEGLQPPPGKSGN